MTDLVVSEYRSELVVDSRLVAERLGIEHKNFMQTIKKYQNKIEQRFGTITFETASSIMPDGRINPKPEKLALLTENQAIALMTFSRNTDEVVECKLALVEAFAKAKKVISQPSTSLEALQFAVNQMVEQERRTRELELQQKQTVVRVAVIEQRLEGLNSADTGYHTVRAYCRLNEVKLSHNQALSVGKTAGRICRERGVTIGKIADEAYGYVNSYPAEILQEAIAQVS